MSEIPGSDSEFDRFLEEAAETDKESQRVEASFNRISREVRKALDDAGYVPVEDNPEELHRIEGVVQADDPSLIPGEETVAAMRTIVEKQSMHETMAISRIAMVLAAATAGGAAPEAVAEKKRLAYAMIAMDGRPNDRAILDALNAVIPGEPVDPDAEYMAPHYAEATRHKEAAEFDALQRKTEVSRLLQTQFGIREGDDEWQPVFTQAIRMYAFTLPYLGSHGHNRANLSEMLYRLVDPTVDQNITRRLIEFFTTYDGPANT